MTDPGSGFVLADVGPPQFIPGINANLQCCIACILIPLGMLLIGLWVARLWRWPEPPDGPS